MSYLQRVEPGVRAVPSDPSLTGDNFANEHPALWEYLTAVSFADGKSRQVATLTIVVEDGRFKACLNDRANSRSLWISAEGLMRALAHLEAVLQSGGGDWRRTQPWKGRNR